MSDKRLKAFCDGLEMQNIPELMTGTAGDFRRVGQDMAKRIKDLADREARKDVEIERLRDVLKRIRLEGHTYGGKAAERLADRADEALANYEQEKTVIRNTLREERDQLLRKNSQLISVLRWARSTLRQRQDASKVLLERIDDALKKTGEQQ